MKQRCRWIRARILLLGAGVAGLAGWLLLFGQSEADRLRAELEARGERFTFDALGISKMPNEDPVEPILDELREVLGALTAAQVAGETGVVHDWVRSTPPQVAWEQPFLHSCQSSVLAWDKASAIADRLQPELAQFHRVMRNPPPLPSWENQVQMDQDQPIPNYVRLRFAAQGLHQLVQVELHRGAIDAAYTNLLTLVRFCHYQRDSGSLVVQMVRVAITGLAMDAMWHALQAPGWSEEQLETLQRELAMIDLLTPQARTLEMERSGILRGMERYRKDGVGHLRATMQTLGGGGLDSWAWKQRLHHLHWAVFRRRDAELQLIQHLQGQIERSRAFAQGQPLDSLPAVPTPSGPDRVGAWFDDWAEPDRTFPILASYSGAPNWVRILATVARNETKRRLAIVALAVERYRLENERPPDSLPDLAPEYLDEVPVDPFAGNPVVYERRGSEGFVVYAQDSSGNPRSDRDEVLHWPAAEPPLPYVQLLTMEDLAEGEVLELVEFTNAPLIDVIKTLARQAGVNMIFEPRVLQRDWAPVNIRLENVTAVSVLRALLNNQGLRLEIDPRSKISRVTF